MDSDGPGSGAEFAAVTLLAIASGLPFERACPSLLVIALRSVSSDVRLQVSMTKVLIEVHVRMSPLNSGFPRNKSEIHKELSVVLKFPTAFCLPKMSASHSRTADAWDLRLAWGLGTEGATMTTWYRRSRSTDTAYAKSRSPEMRMTVAGAGLSIAYPNMSTEMYCL